MCCHTYRRANLGLILLSLFLVFESQYCKWPLMPVHWNQGVKMSQTAAAVNRKSEFVIFMFVLWCNPCILMFKPHPRLSKEVCCFIYYEHFIPQQRNEELLVWLSIKGLHCSYTATHWGTFTAILWAQTPLKDQTSFFLLHNSPFADQSLIWCMVFRFYGFCPLFWNCWFPDNCLSIWDTLRTNCGCLELCWTLKSTKQILVSM